MFHFALKTEKGSNVFRIENRFSPTNLWELNLKTLLSRFGFICLYLSLFGHTIKIYSENCHQLHL